MMSDMPRKQTTAPRGLDGAPARYRSKPKYLHVRMTEQGHAAAQTGAARMAAEDGLRMSLGDYIEYLTRRDNGLTTHNKGDKA